MTATTTCPTCQEECSIFELRCPHDDTPLPSWPNVRIAQTSSQKDALRIRYEQAVGDTQHNKRDESRKAFEAQIRSNSHAVMSLGYAELRVIVEKPQRVFGTFYQRVEAGLQIPTGGKWDALRGIAEHALYQHQKAHVRFAALSLDHVGVKNYGPCHVTLKESLIARRTSTFEGNNVVFTIEVQETKMQDAVDLPPGHLSDWPDRHLLAVAKHAVNLPPDPPNQQQVAAIVIDQGDDSADDEFIELHIWGSMTVKTIERVVVTPTMVDGEQQPTAAEAESLRKTLTKYDVDVDYPQAD